MAAPENDGAGPLKRSAGFDSSRAAGDSSKESPAESPVTVVGIGASAGGLAALTELFRHVPPRTGLAYVIVQHLSPTHESILAELIGRHAAIPVHQAANGMRVETDCAYVIPPDTKMTLADGHLTVVPRDPAARPPRPIDAFLRSLAEVHGSRTIGVILSGTGSDGALGVRAIKGAGGFTFVQDPESASSDGMPLAAIATDCVDVVAPPAEIAAQLGRLGRHPYLRLEGGEPGDSDAPEDALATPTKPHRKNQSDVAADVAADVAPDVAAQSDILASEASAVTSREIAQDDAVAVIAGFLRRRFGVDFRLYKIGTIERRIRRRMALRKIDTLAGYVDMLHQDIGELGALYGDLLIGVTRFFRDSEVFEALSRSVFPQLLKHHATGQIGNRVGDRPDTQRVRIWVAGCSTGEEAYSIAICVLELLQDNIPGAAVQIFATDLSEAAITVARAGVYPQGIETDVTPERLRRFFTQQEQGYRVTKAVRDCCVFARQNITADPPFSQMDLVSCRNVLIYLQPGAHANVLSLFHYALKPDGVLVLGTSESPIAVQALFKPTDKTHHIYVRARGPARPLHLDFVPGRAVPAHAVGQTVGHANVNDSYDHGPGLTKTTTHANEYQMTNARRSPTVPEVQRAADQVALVSYAPAAVVVDDQLQIVQFRGQTGSYIEPTAGTASLDLLKMVKAELAAELRTAVNTARGQAHSVRVADVSFHEGSRLAYVTIDVTPFRVAGSDEQFFIISFEEAESGSHKAGDEAGHQVGQDALHGTLGAAHNHVPHDSADGSANAPRNERNRKTGSAGSKRKLQHETSDHVDDASVATAREAKIVGDLRQELEATRRHLQAVAEEHASVVEEFQAANEEVQSSNEELQSTNEEIETSKEELQSLNEELTTLNDELRVRIADGSHLNDDLTNLLTSMHVPVIMVDTDLRIRRFTAGAERMVNVIPTDVGRPIGDIKSNIDVPNLVDLITRVIATLEVTEREVRSIEGCWYLMHIRPYRTAEHKIDGAVIIYYDIDARKRATEQSDAARRYAEAIVETVREPLLVLDDTLRVISANRAFYDSFGTFTQDTVDRTIFDLGNGQWDMPSLRGLLERVLSEGEAFNDVEIGRDLPTVGRRTMLLNARRVTSDRNGLPLVLLAIEDVTEQTQARLSLAHANTELAARADELEITATELRGKTVEAQASSRAKTEFLATMSHELRTPLNAIAGYAELLDMGVQGPVTDEQRTSLARITWSQKHLLGLINDILSFAKLETGGVSIMSTDVNVNDLLESVEAMVAPQMARKALRYVVHDPDGDCDSTLAIWGDADKVRQILLNLLTNALNFTETDGSIDVTCGTSDGHVAIGVRDTGIGISADHLSVIFEPFVQVNPSLTRVTDGVGLGLAISRELARAMGGDITVESALGVGSTFTLSLPRVPSRVDDDPGEDDLDDDSEA